MYAILQHSLENGDDLGLGNWSVLILRHFKQMTKSEHNFPIQAWGSVVQCGPESGLIVNFLPCPIGSETVPDPKKNVTYVQYTNHYTNFSLIVSVFFYSSKSLLGEVITFYKG